MFKKFRDSAAANKTTVDGAAHAIRMTPISANPINPVYLYECIRCGAANTVPSAGALKGTCRT